MTHTLIDDFWYPHGNYDENEIVPEFIERHISMRDDGYYRGSWNDIAAGLGYTLCNNSFYQIKQEAEFATRAMVHSVVLGGRLLTDYEQAAFNKAYNDGYMTGQSKVAKQLYELAQFGDFKAIDKYLEVRGAFGTEQEETGPAVQITLAEETKDVIDLTLEDHKVIQFPKSN